MSPYIKRKQEKRMTLCVAFFSSFTINLYISISHWCDDRLFGSFKLDRRLLLVSLFFKGNLCVCNLRYRPLCKLIDCSTHFIDERRSEKVISRGGKLRGWHANRL